jgi:stress-induced morphogen
LTSALDPSFLDLEDTSGGCGTFYRLVVASPSFDGLSLVKQHRRVKEVLKDEISAIHGLTIHTMTDEQYRERKKAQEEAKR